MSEFSSFTNKLNNYLIVKKSLPRELVNEVDAVKAFTYLRTMQLHTKGDYYLYCASLNLLNTYVKQPDAKKSANYNFKSYLRPLLHSIVNNQPEDVYFDYKKDDKGKITLLDIDGIQFSFHNVAIDPLIEEALSNGKGSKNIEWDGIKKQHNATTLFEAGVRGKRFRSNLTRDNYELDEYVEEVAEKYKRKEKVVAR